jgi:4-hydroxy-2-oxoheptanedioate aldolase
MTSFRSRVQAGEPVFGPFASIPHPTVLEICTQAKPDFLCIDCEHSPIDRERLENLVRVCDLGGTVAFVRVPGHGAEAIASALDSGAQALLVPRVSTAEQAQAIVKATRYPPVGERGVGPGRAARYGYDAGAHLRSANEAILLCVQVESAEGLANVDAIAATEGVDLIFVGPFDLATSIEALGPDGAAKLDAAIETIAKAAKAAGKPAGIFRPTTADVGRWAAAGYSLFVVASDSIFLGTGMAATMAAAREAVA